MNLLVLISLIFSNTLGAGNEVGNGGDIVICKKGEITTYQLLDYHESSEDDYKVEKLEIDDEYQIAKRAINNLKKIAPRLYDKYSRDLKSFRLKVKFKKGEEFRDIEDSYHVSIKKGCELKQIAHQRKNLITKDTEIFINRDLYEKLSSFHKGMLITHEIIYEHFIYFGEQTSRKVRLFNRYLYSKDIKGHKSKDFNKLGESLGVPLY